ncbi:hypothetical protein C8R44DRAFT_871964 [Mycena epipterygia]|nr:hypothetical protein C8R44DRAFT_871964 [Mycena epipterygia]
MAELAAGFVGAAATVGAVTLTTVSGFTGRHESSCREEMLDTRRNMDDFMNNLQSGDVTADEEMEFLKTRDEALRSEDEYHESIEKYKGASWLHPLDKIKKKKTVRKAKRSTRRSNHSLRKLNESMHSGSDTSSIYASSGSPPGSNLAVDDLQDWRIAVGEGCAVEIANSESSSSESSDDEPTPYNMSSQTLLDPSPVSAANVEEPEAERTNAEWDFDVSECLDESFITTFQDLHPDYIPGPTPVEPRELEDVDVSRVPTPWKVSPQRRYDDLPDAGDGTVSLRNDMTAHPRQAAQIRRPRRPRDRVPTEWYDPAPEAGGADPT